MRDFAEVFTNEREVKAMVDLVWDKLEDQIKATFLEPSCGNGNFLVEILGRKLALCQSDKEILTAYKSIFGIDIQADNVAECKERLLEMNPRPELRPKVKRILNKNIIVGNFLNYEL